MGSQNYEHGYEANHTTGFLAGLLIGSLAGAGAMLMLAPRSGEKTRSSIQHRSIELRDRAVDTAEDAVAQARVTARQVTDGVHRQAEVLQQRGQELLGEHSERLSNAVETRKKAGRGSH